MSDVPPPRTVADQLRDIPAGESRVFGAELALPSSVRSMLVRIKREADANGHDFKYTTRPEGSGIRVWRLA